MGAIIGSSRPASRRFTARLIRSFAAMRPVGIRRNCSWHPCRHVINFGTCIYAATPASSSSRTRTTPMDRCRRTTMARAVSHRWCCGRRCVYAPGRMQTWLRPCTPVLIRCASSPVPSISLSHANRPSALAKRSRDAGIVNRLLVMVGILCLVAGTCWPWLRKIRWFHLPGDIVIDRPGFQFFLPITSMLLVSGVLSILAWLLRR